MLMMREREEATLETEMESPVLLGVVGSLISTSHDIRWLKKLRSLLFVFRELSVTVRSGENILSPVKEALHALRWRKTNSFPRGLVNCCRVSYDFVQSFCDTVLEKASCFINCPLQVIGSCILSVQLKYVATCSSAIHAGATQVEIVDSVYIRWNET